MLALTFSFGNVQNFVRAVEKMPRLQWIRVDGFTPEQSLEFTCEVILAATSIGKDVVIGDSNCFFMRVTTKSEFETREVVQVLNIEVFEICYRTYYDDIKKFVKNNLKGYCATTYNYYEGQGINVERL